MELWNDCNDFSRARDHHLYLIISSSFTFQSTIMVLSDIGDKSPRDDSYESDPYAAPSEPESFADAADSNRSISRRTGYKMNLSQYPRPFPLLGWINGFTDEKTAFFVVAHSARNGFVSGRPVTQSEFDAQAYHDARLMSIASYGLPVGILGALWREKKTRATYKFPFWTPDFKPDGTGRFNPDKFGSITGPRARAIWQIVRRGSYGVLGGVIGTLAFTIYAMSATLAGSINDPRLQEVMRPLHGLPKEERRIMANKVNDLMRNSELIRQIIEEGPSPEGTPAVPSKWLGMPLNGSRVQDNGPDTAAVSGDTNAQAQAQDAFGQRPKPTREQIMNRMRGIPEARQQQPPASDRGYFDVDDASPTAGSGPPQAPASAWDNLRTQALPQDQRKSGQKSESGGRQADAWASRRNAQSSSSDVQSPQDSSNSYTFSSADEERQLAKDEAQRDFDARVDRERRGEDFNSSEGGRWR